MEDDQKRQNLKSIIKFHCALLCAIMSVVYIRLPRFFGQIQEKSEQVEDVLSSEFRCSNEK